MNALTDFLNAYAGKPSIVDKLTEDAALKMQAEYKNLFNAISKELLDFRKDMNYATWAKQSELLKQVGKMIDEFNGGTSGWMAEALNTVAEASTSKAITHLSMENDLTKPEVFHKEFSKGLADQAFKDAYLHVAGQTDKMKIDLKQMLQQDAAKVFQRAAIDGTSRAGAYKKIREEILTKDPSFEFIDKAGRKWDNGKYFEMLTRTVMMNTANQSYMNTCINEGQDLVKITRLGSPDGCSNWEGKVISLTGATSGYPTYEDAKASKQIFHPRCRHRTVAYHKDLEDIFTDIDNGLTEDQLLQKYAPDPNAGIKKDLNDPNKTVTFPKTKPLKGIPLNGVILNPFPADFDVKSIPDALKSEPELPKIPGKKTSCGVIVMEEDGRMWVYEPENHFGGYEHTFSKGTMESGFTAQQTAIKEAMEELGLIVKIQDFLGDYEKTTSLTRYYVAKRIGGTPTQAGWEANNVKLATMDDLKTLLNTGIDKNILEDFQAHQKGEKKKHSIQAKQELEESLKPENFKFYSEFKKAHLDAGISDKQIIDDKWDVYIEKKLAQSKSIADAKLKSEADAKVKLEESLKPENFTDYSVFKQAHLDAGISDKQAIGEKWTDYEEKQAGKLKLEDAVKANFLNATDLKQVGPQKGSNPGGLYEDKLTGEKWYIKTPKSDLHAQNEFAACKLYDKLGVEAPTVKFVMVNGKLSIASKWEDSLEPVFSYSSKAKNDFKKFHDDFAIDAWLANWDVAGLTFDNIATKAGNAFRLDAGGALFFRAQGDPKGGLFGGKVTELATLRDSSINPQSAKVFDGITNAKIIAGIKKIQKLTRSDIMNICLESGMDSTSANKLTDILVERQNDLIEYKKKLEADAKAAKSAAKHQADHWTHEPYTQDDEDNFKKTNSYLDFLKYNQNKKENLIKDYNLSDVEASSVLAYTNGGYHSLNKELFTRSLDAAKNEEVAAYSRILNSALRKMRNGKKKYATKHDGTVLSRKLHLDGQALNDYLEKWAVGKTDIEHSFLSTSANHKVFSGNVCLLITNKTGIYVNKYSVSTGEEEVIIPSGTRLKVTKIEQGIQVGYSSCDYVIYMEEA